MINRVEFLYFDEDSSKTYKGNKNLENNGHY